MSRRWCGDLLAGAAIAVGIGYIISLICAFRWVLQTLVLGVFVSIPTVIIQQFLRVRLGTRHLSGTRRRSHVYRELALSNGQWQKETYFFQQRHRYNKLSYNASHVDFTQAIDDISSLVREIYLLSWYNGISQHGSVVNEINQVIRGSCARVVGVFYTLDIAKVVVGRILPIITTHIRDFRQAEKAVRGDRLAKTITDIRELDLAIASRFRDGRLHSAVTLCLPTTRFPHQDRLRSTCSRIFGQLMPYNMISSDIVKNLIEQLITCSLFMPLIQTITDPDIWNQQVVTHGKAILQGRLSIADFCAPPGSHPSSASRPACPDAIRLLPGETERRFEKFIRTIRNTDDILEAKKLRVDITSQITRERFRVDRDDTYMRRLDVGKRLLDQKIRSLSDPRSGKRIRRCGVPKPLSMGFYRPGPTSASKSFPFSLKDLLVHPSGLSCFMEFMDRQHLLPMVQFWLVVDGFRNPLEGDIDDHQLDRRDGRDGHFDNGSIDFVIGDAECPGDSGGVDRSEAACSAEGTHESGGCLKWSQSDRDDLEQVDRSYLSNPVLRVPAFVRDRVREFLNAGNSATSVQYRDARHALLLAQSYVYDIMQSLYFDAFRDSDLFYNHIASLENHLDEQGATLSSRAVYSPHGNHIFVQEDGQAVVRTMPLNTMAHESYADNPTSFCRDHPCSKYTTGHSDGNPFLVKNPSCPTGQAGSGGYQAKDDMKSVSGPILPRLTDHAGEARPLTAGSTATNPVNPVKPSLASLGLVNQRSRVSISLEDHLFIDEGNISEYSTDEGMLDEIYARPREELGVLVTPLSQGVDGVISRDAATQPLMRRSSVPRDLCGPNATLRHRASPELPKHTHGNLGSGDSPLEYIFIETTLQVVHS
jgi:hypothetical protein